MADVEKSTVTRLKGFSGLSSLVSTRVWYARLPQDPTLPAVTVQEISAVPASAMGRDTGHVRGRVQVDAWGSDRAEAKEAGEQVRAALQRYDGTHNSSELVFVDMNSAGVIYESEGRIWRHRQDFGVWFTEA